MPPRATVAVEPGLSVEPRGGSWVPASASASAEDDATSRLVCVGGSAPLELNVSARARADLPKVVAARLALRTVQTLDGDLRTNAWYWVESDDPAASSFALAGRGRPAPGAGPRRRGAVRSAGSSGSPASGRRVTRLVVLPSRPGNASAPRWSRWRTPSRPRRRRRPGARRNCSTAGSSSRPSGRSASPGAVPWWVCPRVGRTRTIGTGTPTSGSAGHGGRPPRSPPGSAPPPRGRTRRPRPPALTAEPARRLPQLPLRTPRRPGRVAAGGGRAGLAGGGLLGGRAGRRRALDPRLAPADPAGLGRRRGARAAGRDDVPPEPRPSWRSSRGWSASS